jgi:hypothetical protein
VDGVDRPDPSSAESVERSLRRFVGGAVVDDQDL